MPFDAAGMTDEQRQRLRDELETSLRRMEQAIRDAVAAGDGGRLSTEATRALLANLLDEFERLFGAAERQMLGIGADVLEATSSDLADSGIAENLTTPSEGLLQAQAGDALDELATVKGERSAALRAAVLEMARTTVNPTEAVDALRGELDLTVTQTLTLVDTTVAGLDRTITTEAAKSSGFRLFVFQGPVIATTRPWCRERAGFLFLDSELDETPNDVGPNPPSQYGGGYNCEHAWVPVDVTEMRNYPRWQGRPYPDERTLTNAGQPQLAA